MGDHESSPENSLDSPSSAMFNHSKTSTTSSPNTSRRSIKKRVVSVPITEIEGSRVKGETNAPPSDSWAWRKYGQKPIKGSPFPRGYYRCSSSKGCPARKQVERNRSDPTMLTVTYSCDHNHPWPASKNLHHQSSTASPPPASTATTTQEAVSNPNDQEEGPPLVTQESIEPFLTAIDQFGWFSELQSTSPTMLESPLMAGDIVGDADTAMVFSIREEDESLFADLGELPEWTTV